MSEKIEYIVNLDELEDRCIALRVHSTIIYCYPFVEEVAKHGAKIMTASGKVVKHVQPATHGSEDTLKIRFIIGEFDGERLAWDVKGNFMGEDKDGSMRLVIPQRYFDKQWKSKIKISNGEWEIKYGTKHPTVKVEDRWDEKARKRIVE